MNPQGSSVARKGVSSKLLEGLILYRREVGINLVFSSEGAEVNSPGREPRGTAYSTRCARHHNKASGE